ncbi:MAG TPA: LuxR C-terminal-related transcriptional regulator [Devosia sp.]|jgi:FixJ family two-component response regulator|nr:LuxR C-terminal-related transcriptional regulator [Devosia sp.]
MACKPTLGFATRTEAVLALRAAGRTTRQIADQLGIEPKTVSALEVSAVRAIKRLRDPSALDGRLALLPADILSQMRRAASKRGMAPHELAVRIVRVVVTGDLIDAVLDDEVAG